jgi:DNA polymerase-3 subunit beta
MLLFTAPRDALLAPLQSVSGIVEKRHTLPILSNVLIEKKGDALTLLATDIEIQIRNRTTAALGADDVAITVGARKLQDILRALPDTADVSLTLDDKRITLKAGKSRFQLQTLPAADYPRLAPPEGEGVHFTTTQKAFKKQLAQVQYAMAQQDIRYYLNGLLLVVAGDLLRMVATDGHRLAYAASPLVGDYARTDVILPRKTVVELARQLADSDDPSKSPWSATRSSSASATSSSSPSSSTASSPTTSASSPGPPQAGQGQPPGPAAVAAARRHPHQRNSAACA